MKTSRSLRRMTAAIIIVLSALGNAAMFGRSAAAQPPVIPNAAGFRHLGTIPFTPHSQEAAAKTQGGIYLDTTSRLGFTLGNGTAGYQVTSFDLDQPGADGSLLKIRNSTEIRDANLGPDSHTAAIQKSVTSGGGRLYVTENIDWVRVLDEATLQPVAHFPSPMPTSAAHVEPEQRVFANGRRTPLGAEPVNIGALAYWGGGEAIGGDVLLVLTESEIDSENGERPHVVRLSAWDAKTGREEWVSPVLDACRSGRGYQKSKYGMGLAVSRAPSGAMEAIVGCIGRGANGEIWRVGLNADGSGVGTQTLAGSVPLAADFFMDPDGRRAVALTSSHVGQAFVGVDLDRGGVYGVRNASFAFSTGEAGHRASVSAGLDPRTGRVYALTPASKESGGDNRTLPAQMIIFDARVSPMPQGLEFAELNPEGRAGHAQIAVDPASGDRPTRVFVRYSSAPNANPTAAPDPEMVVRVFEDAIPIAQAVPFGQEADALTDGVPETPGKTRSGFTATATGYGFRSILVGGLQAVSEGVFVKGESVTKDEQAKFTPNPCMSASREVSFAAVLKGTALSDLGSSGIGTQADADPRTVQDLAQPGSRCRWVKGTTLVNGVDHTSLLNTLVPAELLDGDADITWPYTQAVCGPGETEEVTPRPNFRPNVTRPPGDSYARAECSEDGQKLTVSTKWRDLGTGEITIAEASSQTILEHLPEGGVAVRTESLASGIVVGPKEAPVLRISRVASVATSRAGGFPGSASALYTREWCGIEAGPVDIAGCFDPDEAAALITGLNRVLALRDYEIQLPAIDAELLAGTPKGAQAASQKDRFLAAGDELINNDDSTAVPALQLIHRHDSPPAGRGRQIYQFGGAEAGTSYRVNVIPGGFVPVPRSPSTPGPVPSRVKPFSPSSSTGVAPLTTERFLAETPASSRAPAPAPAPKVGRPLPSPLYAIGRAIDWLLRNPLEALKVSALIFAAFALPIHLYERRRAVIRAALEGEA